MLSFLGLRKDSKKSTSEKETDGGFVIVGEKHNLILKWKWHVGIYSRIVGNGWNILLSGRVLYLFSEVEIECQTKLHSKV